MWRAMIRRIWVGEIGVPDADIAFEMICDGLLPGAGRFGLAPIFCSH